MEWTRGPTIGRGSTATVSLATAISGERFAVKSTELSHSLFLQKEQCFLSKLSSPHVVKYMGCNVSMENNMHVYNLCMEYVPGGTLFDAIRRRGGQLEEHMIQLYTHQIVKGLEYLHGFGLAHCDIKSQNILVTELSTVKIADLGCAKLVQKISGEEDSAATPPPSTFSGTPVFMAPEVARGEKQGFEADIWALGCTVIEMATGGSPWPEISDPVSALYRIGFSGDLPEFPSRLSGKAKDFLTKCLMKDPRERWTAKELLEHPFVQDLGSNDTEQVKELTFMSSPISVLDQGLWDSIEVFESPQKQSHQRLCSNSPSERIKRLIGFGGTFSAVSNVPNWEWDENWFTIRSNGAEDTQNLVKNINNAIPLAATASNVASIVHEELNLDSSMCDEELAFELEFNSTIGSDVRGFVMAYGVTEHAFVSNNFDFEKDNKNFHFVHSQCCHSCLDFAGQVMEATFSVISCLLCLQGLPLLNFNNYALCYTDIIPNSTTLNTLKCKVLSKIVRYNLFNISIVWQKITYPNLIILELGAKY